MIYKQSEFMKYIQGEFMKYKQGEFMKYIQRVNLLNGPALPVEKKI